MFLTCSSALPAETLTLPQAYQLALKRSEDLAGQVELVFQAEQRLTQARANLFPNLGAVWTYTWQDPATPSISSDQRNLKLAGSWNLFRGFKDFCAIQAAGRAVEAQGLARQWAAKQLYSDTAQALYQALAQALEAGHLEGQLKITQDRVADLKGRVAIGRSRPSDLSSTRANAAALMAQVEASRAAREVARGTLAFITGLEEPEPQDPGDLAVELPSLGILLKQAEQRPDLRAARLRAEAAQALSRAGLAAHLPSLDASANYHLDRLQPKPWMAWDAGLALTLPLFSGLATQARASELASQAREAGLAAERLARSSAQQIRGLRQSLLGATAQVAALRESRDLAQAAYQALKRDYDNGLASNQEVLTALNAHQDALRSHDRARCQALILEAQLKAAVGDTPAGPDHGSPR